MDTVIDDWLVHSPQRDTDAGTELACVDQWLNHGLTDCVDHGASLAEDEIVRSLEEFTGLEYFNDSPPPCDDHQIERAHLQRVSASSHPTSSGGDDPSSSDGVGGDTSSLGVFHTVRGAPFRSFSANDLQLLEHQAHLLPSITGLSAPTHQYGSHLGLAGAKARARPVLESVPEGTPSPGGILPMPPALMAIPASSAGPTWVGGAEHGACAVSPALGTSPGSALYLSCSAPEPGAAANRVPAPDGSAAALSPLPTDPASCRLPAGPLPPYQPGGSSVPLCTAGSSSALRHVPSTGTLSALMSNTLSFQGEGTGESTQTAPQPQRMSPTTLLEQQPKQEIDDGAAAAAHALPLVTTAPDPTSGAAVAAGVFPVAAVPGVQQPFALVQPAGLYGVAPVLYPSAVSFPPGHNPLGLALPLPPPNMAPSPAVGADDAAGANAGCKLAAAAAAAPGAGGGGDTAAAIALASGPRLRKSQSALELGAWRSISVEPAPESTEAASAGQKLIGQLTPEERLQRILRYRSKRNTRNFNREIKYQCRKTLADSRPRVGGRFARNDDPNSVLPHQTKKAMRMKKGAATQGSNNCKKHNSNKNNAVMVTDVVAADAAGGDCKGGAVATAAAAATGAKRQLHPGASQPAHSTTTRTSASSSGDGQAAARVNSRTAEGSAAMSGAKLSGAPSAGVGAARTEAAAERAVFPHVSVFAAACGLPYPYGVSGMPYALHGGMLPGGLMHSPPGLDVAQLHHHYAVVNAAAQAAAQGVYAHLAMAPAGGLPPAALGVPQVTAATLPLPPSQVPAKPGEASMACGPVLAAELPAEGAETPLMESLWGGLGADVEARAQVLHGQVAAEVLGPALPCGSGCGVQGMAVDG